MVADGYLDMELEKYPRMADLLDGKRLKSIQGKAMGIMQGRDISARKILEKNLEQNAVTSSVIVGFFANNNFL